ncbi:excalibur calcium-binding domain-containing protein [Shewanella sp. VB17]|uniref:excalibur calcium-binding domain-containing protein n=1 Tax=Shewanella sp. VB17 TaxID=2739432 RepID=UPI00156689FF|nr:excalibur calcium-binding domain-containing protein [Shewanella sp. VB17]
MEVESSAPTQIDKKLAETPTTKKIEWIQTKELFSCEEGKQHCSQMRSCSEAKYYLYLKNCPYTKMDGDSDGIHCERQHCSH